MSSTAALACTWLLLCLAPGLNPATAVAAAPAARLVEPIDEAARVALPGHVHRAVRDSEDLGAAERSLPVERLALVLRASAEQDAALERFLRAVQTRGSAEYRHWLTPQAFTERYGVAAADRLTLRRWLESKGLRVAEEPAGGRTLLLSGTLGQFSDAFTLNVHRYRWHGEAHLAAATNPTLPRALAGVVRGFASLHDFRHQAQRLPGRPRPAYTSGGAHYLLPGDFATIYDLGSAYARGITGSGRRIAVLGRSDVTAADLSTFRSLAGLAANAPQLIVNGADPGRVSGDELESDLDLQWAGAVAPAASVVFVTSGSTTLTDGIDLSAQYAVSNNLADVISLSYGSCEAVADVTGGTTYYQQLWQQAAAQGISVFVSSGDSGAAGCDAASATQATRGLGINRLCSSAYSTCVGGTQFAADVSNPGAYWTAGNGAGNASALGYIPEAVWNQSGTSLYASGGGASLYVAKPAWQLASGVPSDGRRDVPDVSLSASGAHDGYLVYTSDGYATPTLLSIGGTSAAAPAMAGIAALVVQQQGGRVGNFNPVLYGLSDRQVAGGAAVFHRITSGNNSVPGQTGYAASTTNPTYNQASGLGSVDGAQLLSHWNDVGGTATGLAPATVTLPAGTFVGNATLTVPATMSWSAAVASSGGWLVVTPAGGTGPAALTYGASANYAPTPRTGTITIAGQVLSVTQAAAAAGSGGQLALSTTGLNFGTDAVGVATARQRVIVSNVGSAALTLGAIGLGGGAAADYATSGSCTSGLVLAAGASCYLDLVFDPTALGTRSASLSVGVNGGTATAVTVTGLGAAAATPANGADGPLPLWSYAALGLALVGVARRRLSLRP